jgi:hypothetical protein
MQAACFNGVMKETAGRERTKFNLALPSAVMSAFEEAAMRYGGGRRWMLLTAAVAAFLSMPREKQDEWMQRVSAADLSGDFSGLMVEERPPRIGRINSAAGGKSADKEPM